jgi:hypothetical protein
VKVLCTLRKQGFQCCLQSIRGAFLPSVGNLVLFLFNRGARALLLSGTVGSAWPPALWGGKPPGTSKAWSLGFTCVCGGRLLALSSKLRVSMW